MSSRLKQFDATQKQQIELSRRLQKAFSICMNKKTRFTKYKEAPIYSELKETIHKKTGIQLSVSTLRDIIMLKHRGKFNFPTIVAIDKFISSYTKDHTSLLPTQFRIEPRKQKIFWGVNQNLKSGIFINRAHGLFIGWKKLKIELEKNAISQCPRIIPHGSKVELGDFYGKKYWIIWILDKNENRIGSVWLGGNPQKNWHQDGLVRIGETINDSSWRVWQILQRYSDGSYRIIKSFV